MVAPRINLAHNARPFTLAGWSNTAGNASTVAYVAAVGPGGTTVGLIRSAAATSLTHAMRYLTPTPGGVAGVPVPVSVWVRSSVAVAQATIRVRFELVTGTGVGVLISAAPVALPAGVPTQLTLTGTPTGAYEQVAVTVDTSAFIGNLDAANVLVATTGAPLDGDMPDAGGVSYWWNGTPYSSSSTAARIVQATPNLDTGSVLLEVNVDPSLSPTVIYERTALEIAQGYTPVQVNDYNNWTGWAGHELVGATAMKFRTSTSPATVARPITGLIVGRQYRVRVVAQRGAVSYPFGVVGSLSTIPAGSGTWQHEHVFTATATTHSVALGSVGLYTVPVELVALDLLPVGYVSGDFSLTRTDVNGTRQVRLLAGQALTSGTLVVEDHEAALTGMVTYSLNYGLSAFASTSTTLEGITGYRIAPALSPQFGVTAGDVTGYTGGRETSTFAHHVIGRPEPVMRLGTFRSRRGVLTYWCATYVDLRELVAAYDRREVVQLRQRHFPGLDMYHVALSATESPYDEAGRRWRLDVDYVEVGYPGGPLLGTAGWSWDDLLAMFPTWDDVLAFFDSWTDAQIGPE